MKRDEFLKSSLILGGASLLPSSNVFSQSLKESGMDKLTDADGNFGLQPLPYAETFLEPSMDQETLHLHYTFHHGDAVKAANKDLAEIKKAIDANTLDTVDYWTKRNYHSIYHLTFFIQSSGLISPTKKAIRAVNCSSKSKRILGHTTN